MEGSGAAQMITDPDPRGPITPIAYGSYESRYGSGTLARLKVKIKYERV
jgi:hypothetical protein